MGHLRHLLAGVLLVAAVLLPAAARAQEGEDDLVGRICDLIETESIGNGLPAEFLARLIWKESLFNPNAVSPKGAEGIAQFMPATASRRGLEDPFDIEQAIAAAASYLSDLTAKFGNFALAAAAYNAGEARVARWIANGGFLPIETENFVLDIFGGPPDDFLDRSGPVEVPPLDAAAGFNEACRRLPVTASTIIPMASVGTKPWGIQLAGHFRRDVAIRMWQRLRGSIPAALAGQEPTVSRVRSARGRRGIYAVRIGLDSRREADRICARLKQAGAACIVLRNH